MSFLLTKLLPLCLYPLGTAILLALFAMLLRWLSLRRLSNGLLVIAIVYLWTMSTPIVGEHLLARLESKHPPISLSETQAANAAIVLGGAVGYLAPPRQFPEMNDNAGRVVHAARLYHAGKVPRIIVTGGNFPWGPDSRPEAELIRDLLVEWGVPRDAIVLETQSLNTRQNAVNTARIFKEMGLKSGLLVTSGFHMERALRTFQKAGMDLTPVSSGVKVVHRSYQFPLDYLPQDVGLRVSTRALKEWIGTAVYRFRGWI